jgi:predicted nucleic acid-binding protein
MLSRDQHQETSPESERRSRRGARECILDTNVFVAAGFNPKSDSAWILRQLEQGHLRMVWNEATRREIERIMRQIPRLSWERIAHLFREEDCCREETHPEQFASIPDPDDRKFAALSKITGATLVTGDRHLLQARETLDTHITSPGQFRQQMQADRQADDDGGGDST